MSARLKVRDEWPKSVRTGQDSNSHAVPPRLESPVPLHRARSDPRALRADLRAPARRLGRQRHQDRDAGTRRKGRHGRAAARARIFRICTATSAASRSISRARKASRPSRSWSKKADVVVENYRPDVKRRLGIDYKDLAKINKKIVYASISGFGQTGPYAGRPGLRPDRAGHGRADVDHRAAGSGAGARRHRGRRSYAPDCSPRSAF